MRKLLLSSVVFMLIISLCACSFSVSTANFQNLKMASSIDEDSMEPIAVTDVFSPTTPVIYLTGTLKNSPDDTVIKAEWRYVENEPAVDIDSAESVTKDINTDFQFNISIPDNGWPIGKYEVKLYINDEAEKTVSFEVADEEVADEVITTETTAQASVKNASFNNLKMASIIDENTYLPITLTDTFAQDAPIIYLTGSINNAETGTLIRAEWRYIEDDPAFDIDSVTLTTEEENTDFQFNLSIPNDGWPAGKYEVKLLINDVYKVSVPFSVS